MNPLTIAGLVSTGAGVFNSLFGGPDPGAAIAADRRYMAEAQRYNERMVQDRQNQINALFGGANARLGMARQYAQDFLGMYEPQLAFSDRQARLGAGTGARAAQANLRRSLGSGGDIFASTLAAGARTGSAAQQSTLRAMATAEAMRAGRNQALTESQLFTQRAGMTASLPMPFMQAPPLNTQMLPYEMAGNQQRTNMFGNLATGLGYLGHMRSQRPSGQTTTPTGIPLAPGQPGAPGPWQPFAGPRRENGLF